MLQQEGSEMNILCLTLTRPTVTASAFCLLLPVAFSRHAISIHLLICYSFHSIYSLQHAYEFVDIVNLLVA